MHKTISILTLASLLFSAPVYAQEDITDTQEEEVVAAPPPKPTNGYALQNWLFAGGSIIAATIAIVLVAINPGSPPPESQRTLPN